MEGLGAWGPLAIVVLEMIQALLAPIPGQAIEAVSGYLYGPWWGTLFPMIGMVLGSTITFLLGVPATRSVHGVGKRREV